MKKNNLQTKVLATIYKNDENLIDAEKHQELELLIVESMANLDEDLNEFKGSVRLPVDYYPAQDNDVATKGSVISAIALGNFLTGVTTTSVFEGNGTASSPLNGNFNTTALGSVSGTVDVDMSLGTSQYTATITATTTFNITNVILNKPLLIIPTGAFTINVPTSSGVTFNLMTNSDTYTSGKSRLWIIFNSATQADYFFKNIE